jgi:Restriction endonuclease BglII
MRTHVESHQYAETVLEGRFREEWEQLLEVLGTLEVPLRPAEPFTRSGRPKSPKRQSREIGGRRASALMPVDQAQMNRQIRTGLSRLGWNPEPYILIDREGHPIDTRLRGDFEKSGVFVEVEFGNVASFYRDLFKFHIAGTTGAAHVGVIVVATDALARLFDQGQARFEQAVSLLPYMRAGVQLPTAIVGLDVNDWSQVRARYDEMRLLVESHGEACHSFDAVMRP